MPERRSTGAATCVSVPDDPAVPRAAVPAAGSVCAARSSRALVSVSAPVDAHASDRRGARLRGRVYMLSLIMAAGRHQPAGRWPRARRSSLCRSSLLIGLRGRDQPRRRWPSPASAAPCCGIPRTSATRLRSRRRTAVRQLPRRALPRPRSSARSSRCPRCACAVSTWPRHRGVLARCRADGVQGARCSGASTPAPGAPRCRAGTGRRALGGSVAWGVRGALVAVASSLRGARAGGRRTRGCRDARVERALPERQPRGAAPAARPASTSSRSRTSSCCSRSCSRCSALLLDRAPPQRLRPPARRP